MTVRSASRTLASTLLAAAAALSSTGCVDTDMDQVGDVTDETVGQELVVSPIAPVIILPLFPMRRTFTGDEPGQDACHAIAAGPADSFIVTGEVRRVVQGYNAWNRAYDAAGATLWTKEINTPSEGNDRGNDLVALADGSAVVAGKWYSGSPTKANYFLTKLSSLGGTLSWDESALANDDMYLGVARNSVGELIAVGSQPDGGVATSRGWVRKLKADGSTQLWSAVRNGSAAGFDVANKVAVDSFDNVYVVGYEQNEGTGRDGWLRKYDNAGVPSWGISYATIGADDAADIAMAGNNEFALATQLGVNGSIRMYTAAGSTKWLTSDAGVVWRAVAIDVDNNVVATGSKGVDLIVRKYNSSGTQLWQRTWANARGNGIAVDAAKRVLVCGAENTATGTDGLVLRYLP